MPAIKAFLKVILYKPLFNALIFLVWLVPSDNLGIAIIILTILVRLVLLPSSIKATQSQKKLRDLQPELDKLKEKHKDDRQALAKATMDFYRVHKINPMGACLPLLIQFPVLIILYYVFRTGLSTARFDDLLYGFTPRPEAINVYFLGIDLSRPDRWVLPLLAGALQYIQARQVTPVKSAKVNKNNKGDFQSMMGNQMLYIMPLFTVIIARSLVAALPLYWVVTTLFAVVQQWWTFSGPGSRKTANVTISVRKKDSNGSG